MRFVKTVYSTTLAFIACGTVSAAEINVATYHNGNEKTSMAFRFSGGLEPVKSDAGASAKIMLVKGQIDPNSGGLKVLNDDALPTEEDQPQANFFLAPGEGGGRLLIDLGKQVSVRQINTFSWHPQERGPQVYRMYVPADAVREVTASIAAGELDTPDWKPLSGVDTGEAGGQYAVSFSGPGLGKQRYLIMDISSTDPAAPFAQTFFSEIDVIDAEGPEKLTSAAVDVTGPGKLELLAGEGRYQIMIDTSETPDLREWVEQKLAPVVVEWYPKLVKMLPGEKFQAPERVTIFFGKDMEGVANASGNRIRCAAKWFRNNLEGEAKGAVVHELVHVVQQYGWGRRNNPDVKRTPGWLVEGIPDYVRFFLYEPETKGAEITNRNLERAKYDSNYRISGNFLNYVVTKYDQELVPKLNALCREGKYTEEFWKERTGKTLEELGAEWKTYHHQRLAESK